MYPNSACRPVEKSSLLKFQDLFDALKDILCPPDEDDAKQLELEQNQHLPRDRGESQQQQKISQLLLLYAQCLSSFVSCFSNAVKDGRERENGDLSLPDTHILQILMWVIPILYQNQVCRMCNIYYACFLVYYVQSTIILTVGAYECRELRGAHMLLVILIQSFCRKFPTSLPLLCSLCQYSEVATEELAIEKMFEVLPMLHRNLTSPSSSVSALYIDACCDVVSMILRFHVVHSQTYRWDWWPFEYWSILISSPHCLLSPLHLSHLKLTSIVLMLQRSVSQLRRYQLNFKQ